MFVLDTSVALLVSLNASVALMMLATAWTLR